MASSRFMKQTLRIRVMSEGLRSRSGQYRRYGAPGARFFAELGDSKEKFAEAHEQLARLTQDEVVTALKNGIKRRSTSSGRLEAVTADPENIVANDQGWGVGVKSFLDQSQAKYWRTIDEGSEAVWKRPFKGRFYYVARKEAWGGEISHGEYRSYAVGDFMPAMKGRNTEKLRPFPRGAARELIAEQGKLPRWMGRMYITKEIAAEDYYERGFARTGKAKAELRVISNVLDRMFYRED